MVGAPGPLVGWPPAFGPAPAAAAAGGAALGTPPNVVGAWAPWGLVQGEPLGLTARQEAAWRHSRPVRSLRDHTLLRIA